MYIDKYPIVHHIHKHATASPFFSAIVSLNLIDLVSEEIIRVMPQYFDKDAHARVDLEQYIYNYIEWLGTNWDELVADDYYDIYNRFMDILAYAAQTVSIVDFYNMMVGEVYHLNTRIAYAQLVKDEPYQLPLL